MLPQKQLLIEALECGVVDLVFTKADQTVRRMCATLQPRLLPPRQTTAEAQPPAKEHNLLKVWDVEAGGWRSLRLDRLQSWETKR